MPRAQQRRPAPRAPRRRALFYSHDVFGLGHMRSTLTIVSEVARLRADAALLALTGSFQTDAWELPSNFDYIKLPTMTKRLLYAGLPERAAPGGFVNHTYLREAVIEGVVDAFEPQLVFVENAPAGLEREMARALACLRAAAPQVTLVAGLGDIIDDARSTIDWWRREGVYELLEDVYDRILIYGDRRVYDPLVEYHFTPGMVAKTEFCGYLTRADAIRPPGDVRRELGAEQTELIVVTAGGGADGAELFRAYLTALREPGLRDTVSFLVTGPLIDPRSLADLQRAAQAMPRVTLVPFTNDIMSYVNAADLVIMKGGYNTTCDVLGLGKRALMVPRPRPQEQALRARRLATLGLVDVLEQQQLTAARLAAQARALLGRPAPPVTLDFGGRERIGQLLAELLDA